MALQQIPGYNSGYIATRYSSMNKRSLGKLTSANHISSIHSMEPAMYDKKIISLYTQTSLYANDFLQMIMKNEPYFIDKATNYWQWKVAVPYQFPTLIRIPDSTLTASNLGIDRQTFDLVFDKKDFFINDTITPNRMYGQQFIVTNDPVPDGRGWRYTLQLVTMNPMTTTVDLQWIAEGREYERLVNNIGEWDERLSGLGELGDEITLYQSLGAGNGVEHTVTEWADVMYANRLGTGFSKDKEGNTEDLIVYEKKVRNEQGVYKKIAAWEPFIEMEMRKRMIEDKVKKMIWQQAGSNNTGSGTQELKKLSMGVYPQMRAFGNLEQYNAGQFSINILRNVFGDLFYRRKDFKDRMVKLYTNEAGMEVFNTAAKDDLLKQGFTIIADNRFIQGTGRHMVINYAFDQVVTQETGNVELIHLMELDLPQTNSEFGRNKKSTPVYMVFDVSNQGGGVPASNVREVRNRAYPSMTWGYQDGTYHHLGHAKSQGMSSSGMFPGYKVWMKDRYDVFIEDITRTVLIEQVPQF
jgi:hypothetical protein